MGEYRSEERHSPGGLPARGGEECTPSLEKNN